MGEYGGEKQIDAAGASNLFYSQIGVTTKNKKKRLRICHLIANIGIPIIAIIFILSFFMLGLVHSSSQEYEGSWRLSYTFHAYHAYHASHASVLFDGKIALINCSSHRFK